MDGFNYTNIFDTKGIEYIVIILFFIALVPFWIIVNKKTKISTKVLSAFRNFSFENLRIPQGIFLSKNHSWAFLEQSGTAIVGVDDFLIQVTGMGKLEYHKQGGENVIKGDLIADFVKGDKVLRIYSPISGKVLKSNSILVEESAVLGEDPFGKGWIYRIEPSGWLEETKSLYLGEEAIAWSKNEIVRLKDFIMVNNNEISSVESELILQDGGELVTEPLSGFPSKVWDNFQEKFLCL